MPIDPLRLCQCHGEPMFRLGTSTNCVSKRRERVRRYQASARGTVAKLAANGRRVRIGRRHVLSARTPVEARAINAHIKEQLLVFQQGFSGGTQTQITPAV